MNEKKSENIITIPTQLSKPHPIQFSFRDEINYYAFLPLSASVFNLSKEAYEALSKTDINSSSPAEKEIQKELKEIVKQAEMHYSNFINSTQANLQIKAISLMVQQSCNLACHYCYAGKGEYGRNSVMKSETAIKAVDYFIKDNPSLHISFFGGEPLLNFSLMREVVEHCDKLSRQQEKTFTFSVTTNGTLIDDEILAFLNDHSFTIILSIDGDEKTHNAFRPFAGKEETGSFSKVYSSLKTLESKYKAPHQVLARSTVTPETVDQLFSNLKFFHNKTHSHFSVHPQMGGIGQKPWSKSSITKYSQGLNQFIDYLIEQDDVEGLKRMTFLVSIINRIHYGELAYSFCGAGKNYLSVSTSGEIFPCHRFNEQNPFESGNIFDGIKEILLAKFTHEFVHQRGGEAGKVKCHNCYIKHICGGGCFADNQFYKKNLTTPYEPACQLIEADFLCALKIYCFLKKHHPQVLDDSGPTFFDLR